MSVSSSNDIEFGRDCDEKGIRYRPEMKNHWPPLGGAPRMPEPTG
jgi:hypothetical protein